MSDNTSTQAGSGIEGTDLYSGRYGITEALRQLRLRLLDLTARNRLLNFKHSPTKSLQVIQAVPAQVFSKVLDGNTFRFQSIPDPNPSEYLVVDGKRSKPEVRDHAKKLGINPSYELPEFDETLSRSEGRLLRVLHYPEDLERRCRRIARDAKTAIEETGTNMLYLVFGFLEFYDSEDSEKPLLAPLVAVPVVLARGTIDRATGLYQYDVTWNGEEISDNLSLREKLRQDFGIQLPEFDDENGSQGYLKRVDELITRKPGWKVRRQITLTLLSFAKMLIVKDLDPANWPKGSKLSALNEHPMLQLIFEGREPPSANVGAGGEYIVDSEQQTDIPLIYDADSSQHRALIDALSGRHLVINGPPGTGKSQTITNLIAAAMVQGKKILFVSEKLAALEVVKNRLDMAGLGKFCLELHSNRTQKKKFVENLATRYNEAFTVPRGLGDRLEILDQHQKRLKSYAELLNTQLGNELGMTVHEIVWAAERYRQEADIDLSPLQSLTFEAATSCSPVRLAEMKAAVESLCRHYRGIGYYDERHPWYGFFPMELNPGDDLTVRRSLEEFISGLDEVDNAMARVRDITGIEMLAGERNALAELLGKIESPPPPTPGHCYQLLSAFFNENDPSGRESSRIIEQFKQRVDEAKGLIVATADKLFNPDAVRQSDALAAKDKLKVFRTHGYSENSLDAIKTAVGELKSLASRVEKAIAFFLECSAIIGFEDEAKSKDIRGLMGILEVAHRAPRELMDYRHGPLASPAARAQFNHAHRLVNEIEDKRKVLDEVFYPPEEIDLQSLHFVIRVFRDGDTWYRILQRDWRSARRIYRSLTRNKLKKSSSQCLRELSDLRDHLDSRSRFLHGQEHQSFLGPLFRGLETDFENVETLITWFEDSRSRLIEVDVSLEALDLVNIPHLTIERLASRFGVAKEQFQAFSEAEERVRFLVSGSDSPGDLINEEISWKARTLCLKALANDLETSLDFFEDYGPGVRTPAELTAAIEGRVKLKELLDIVNNSADAKRLLGDMVQGIETNFGPLLETHAWGKQVLSAGLPNEVCKKLLGVQAIENYNSIANTLKTASAAWLCVDQFVAQMSKIAPFRWTQWNAAVLDDDGAERSELLRSRAITAMNSLDDLLPWAQYVNARKAVVGMGFKSFVEKIEQGSFPSEKGVVGFLYRFYGSIAESVFRSRPELARFSSNTHEQIREEFAQLDKETINLRGKECAAQIAKAANPPRGVRGSRVDDMTEMELLHHLMGLQRPRMPIRKIVGRAARAVQQLKPCFMMGPLAVAQYLQPGAVKFDIVVMDEASQLKPEEAIGAVARGNQMVIVGDPKQLPPTTFFDRLGLSDEDEDEGQLSPSTAFESILDICTTLFRPPRTLRWHYRSKHESLIAFSNHQFYNEQLIVFPSPYPKTRLLGLRRRYIENGLYQNRQNIPEAHRVVAAVIDHMLNCSDYSLGVVTLNLTQRDLIEDLLDKKLRNIEQAERYKARWETEGWPFFVKNLENVQGDECDVIFISTTFGKAQGTNVVRQNFGPISRPTGWRRLNVLFTRARRSVHLFTSMQPEDIVIDSKTPEGTRALRAYLEYASKGLLGDVQASGREPESDFEISVANVLRQKGYEIEPQVGTAGYFIDMGVRNPDRRGEFLAAIECDGASYHSGVSVRDRDRIRQEVLESLGWKGKIHRIWSTDWYRSPAREIAKLLAFLESRRKNALQEGPRDILDTDETEEKRLGERYVPHDEAEQLTLDVEISEGEELFVEVGDTITFSYVANPEEKQTYRITQGPSQPESRILNEKAPLAQAVLGASEGDEVEAFLPGQPPRSLRVLKIERGHPINEESANRIPGIPGT